MTVLKEYKEGLVTFLSADVEYYTEDSGQPTADMPVFYNPRMRLNRDMSVIFASAFNNRSPMRYICEPLAGSGIRTLRYLREIQGDFEAVMFDTNPNAIEVIQRNIALNDLEDRARIVRGDARVLLLEESKGKRFDFVDVDPFGSPAPFLNAAVQSIIPRRGLLALTATDMPALCGVFPHVAQRKYGGLSIRAPFSHELAVRLLVGLAFSVAGMNDCSITPLAVLSTDHYIRVWLEQRSSRATANIHSKSIGIVRFCPNCMNYDIIPLTELGSMAQFAHIGECQAKIRVAGPLWIGPLYDNEFLREAKNIETQRDHFHKKTSKIMHLMVQEQELTETPYVDLHELCDAYNLSPPRRQDVMDRLAENGYGVSRTHFRPTAIRTDASVEEVLRVLRDVIGES